MFRKVIDGKPVIIKSSSKNIPSINHIRNVYSKIPDDKRIPIVFQTKTQYLKEYIKNQEKAKGVDFTPKQERAYIHKELKGMSNVVSRYTTKANPFIDLRTVFFTDKKITPKQFTASAFHEYGHEAWEKNPKIRKDWRTVNRSTAPTAYGKTDRQEDYAESYMQYRLGELRDPKRIQLLKDYRSRNAENWDAMFKYAGYMGDLVRKGKRCKRCNKPINPPTGHPTLCKQCGQLSTDNNSYNMPFVKETTVPAVDYPKEYHSFIKKKTVKMTPEEFLEGAKEEASLREARKGRYANAAQLRRMSIGEYSDSWLSPEDQYIDKETGKPLREAWKITSRVERVKKGLLSGKNIPGLYLEKDVAGRPIGHEGRHRALAAKELGIKELPVHIMTERPYTKTGPFSGDWDMSEEVKIEDTIPGQFEGKASSPFEDETSNDKRIFHKDIKIYKTDNTPFFKKALSFWTDKPLPPPPTDTPQEEWLNEQSKMMSDKYGVNALYEYDPETTKTSGKKTYTSATTGSRIQYMIGQGISTEHFPSVDDISYYYDTAPTEYTPREIILQPKPRTLGPRTWASYKDDTVKIYPKRKAITFPYKDVRQILTHETGHKIEEQKRLLPEYEARGLSPKDSPSAYARSKLRLHGYTPEAKMKSAQREDIAETFSMWHPKIGSGHVNITSAKKARKWDAISGSPLNQPRKAEISDLPLIIKDTDPWMKERSEAWRKHAKTALGNIRDTQVGKQQELKLRTQFLDKTLGTGFKKGMTPREEYELMESPESFIEEGLDEEARRKKWPATFREANPEADLEKIEKIKSEKGGTYTMEDFDINNDGKINDQDIEILKDQEGKSRALRLKDTRKYKFGTIAWQEAMEDNINEKMAHGEEFGLGEKSYIDTQSKIHPREDIDTFKKVKNDS